MAFETLPGSHHATKVHFRLTFSGLQAENAKGVASDAPSI